MGCGANGGSSGGPDKGTGVVAEEIVDVGAVSGSRFILLVDEVREAVLALPGEDAEGGRSSKVLMSTLAAWLAS